MPFNPFKIIAPSKDFVLLTPLSPEEVERRLMDLVEPPGLFRNPFKKEKPLRGSVEKGKFSLEKYGTRGAWTVLFGKILPDENGSRVCLEFRTDYLPVAFGALFLTAFMIFLVAAPIGIIVGGRIAPAAIGLGVLGGFCAFFSGVGWLSLKTTVGDLTSLLLEALQGEEVSPPDM